MGIEPNRALDVTAAKPVWRWAGASVLNSIARWLVYFLVHRLCFDNGRKPHFLGTPYNGWDRPICRLIALARVSGCLIGSRVGENGSGFFVHLGLWTMNRVPGARMAMPGRNVEVRHFWQIMSRSESIDTEVHPTRRSLVL